MQTNNQKNVSTTLLKHLSNGGSAAAMRQLALMYLKGIGIPKDEKNGRTLLLIAAHSGDRGASWLLAGYYLAGSYGFQRNRERADCWRLRTERRLRVDAWQEYLDPETKRAAIRRHETWKQRWSACDKT